MSTNFRDLISKVVFAIEMQQVLTRKRANGLVEEPEIAFSNGEWHVRCRCRHLGAKGRGSQQMHDIDAHGETPEKAVAAFIKRLPAWTEILSR